jgi:hypothetical protein
MYIHCGAMRARSVAKQNTNLDEESKNPLLAIAILMPAA